MAVKFHYPNPQFLIKSFKLWAKRTLIASDYRQL